MRTAGFDRFLSFVAVVLLASCSEQTASEPGSERVTGAPRTVTVRVTIEQPGAATEELDRRLLDVTSIPGVLHSRSIARAEYGHIDLQFEASEKEAIARTSSVEGAAARLLEIRWATLFLTSEGDRPLASQEVAAVKTKLERLPGVRHVAMVGGKKSDSIDVALDARKLRQYNLDPVTLLTQLRALRFPDADPPGGHRSKRIESLERLVVASRGNATVRLADVARIHARAPSSDGFVYRGSHHTVALRVNCQPTTDLSELKGPAGTHVEMWDEADVGSITYSIAPGRDSPSTRNLTTALAGLDAAFRMSAQTLSVMFRGVPAQRVLQRLGRFSHLVPRRVDDATPPLPVAVMLTAGDRETLKEATKAVQSHLARTGRDVSVLSDLEPETSEITLTVDPQKASELGATVSDVRTRIALLMRGCATSFGHARIADARPRTLQEFGKVRLVIGSHSVPLQAITRPTTVTRTPSIQRADGMLTSQVTVLGTTIGSVRAALDGWSHQKATATVTDRQTLGNEHGLFPR